MHLDLTDADTAAVRRLKRDILAQSEAVREELSILFAVPPVSGALGHFLCGSIIGAAVACVIVLFAP